MAGEKRKAEGTLEETVSTGTTNEMKFWGSYVFVKDFDRAVNFYTETLGLKLLMRHGNHWAEVQAGGSVIGLHPMMADAEPVASDQPFSKAGQGATLTFIMDTGLPEMVERLKGKGVKFHSDVLDAGGRLMANFQDSEGNWLHIYQYTRKQQQQPQQQ